MGNFWGKIQLTLALVLALSTFACKTEPDAQNQTQGQHQGNFEKNILGEEADGPGIIPIAYVAPPADANKVFVQLTNPNSKTAIVAGLSGAVDSSVSTVSVVRKDEVAFATPVQMTVTSDGSFRGVITNAQVGDAYLLWTDGPGYSAGGPGLNEIEEIVVIWSSRYPARIQAIQDTQYGLMIGSEEGLYLIEEAVRTFAPEYIYPRRWTEADQLPNNGISAIAQDPSGNVWIGSGTGYLSIFDFDATSGKATFQNFDLSNGYTASYNHNEIHSILPISGDDLWIAQEYGLTYVSYSGGQIQTTTYWTAFHFVDLISDNHGNFFAATRNNGVFHVTQSNGNPILVQVMSGSTAIFVTSVALDPSGDLWIGTSDGVVQVHTVLTAPSYSKHAGASGIPCSITVTDLKVDSNGDVWVATNECVSRLYKANGTLQAETFDVYSGLAANYSTALDLDKDGHIWVGSNEALSRFDNTDPKKPFISFKNVTGLPSNSITHLESDGDGGLWVVSNGALVHFEISGEETYFTVRPHASLDDFRSVSRIRPNGKNGAWVSAGASLIYYEKNGGQILTPRVLKIFPFPNPTILDFEVIGPDKFWIVLDNGGMVVVEFVNNTLVSIRDALPSETTEDPLAFCSAKASQLLADRVFSIGFIDVEPDGSNGCWITTWYEGLIHVKVDSNQTETVRRYATSDGLPTNSLLWLASNPSGGVFAVGHGIVLFVD